MDRDAQTDSVKKKNMATYSLTLQLMVFTCKKGGGEDGGRFLKFEIFFPV